MQIYNAFFSDIDVAVMNSATVKDLKLTVAKKVNEMEQSKMGHRQISWWVLLQSCICIINFSQNTLQ